MCLFQNKNLIISSYFCFNDDFVDINKAFSEFNQFITQIGKSMDVSYPPPKLGSNELNGTFKDHLYGSPQFFRRLFQFSSINDPSSKIPVINELWRRIHYSIFISKSYGRNIIYPIFEPALLDLNFCDEGTKSILARSIDYLEIIFNKYLNRNIMTKLSSEEIYIYNNNILDIALKEDLQLDERFINRLRINTN